jgi:hypothetical protein
VDPSTAGIAGKKEMAGGCESVVRSYTNDEVWKIVFTIGLCLHTKEKKIPASEIFRSVMSKDVYGRAKN